MSYTSYRLLAVEELDLEEKQQRTPSFLCIRLDETKHVGTKMPPPSSAAGAVRKQ